MTHSSTIPRNILVVDDDELYRGSLVRAMTRRGIKAAGADSLKSALEALHVCAPDAAVVDLRLGSESGLAVVAKLLETSQHVRVVVLTAYGTIATALEAVRLGAVNYLTKPAQLEQILEAFQGTTATPRALSAIPSAEQVEWDYINRTVTDYKGNVSRAAQALGLHRRSLQRKLKNPPPIK